MNMNIPPGVPKRGPRLLSLWYRTMIGYRLGDKTCPNYAQNPLEAAESTVNRPHYLALHAIFRPEKSAPAPHGGRDTIPRAAHPGAPPDLLAMSEGHLN
ncbi:MAG: hypothetical protein JWO83_3898 [Caulobacteraceae bacterium]|nr:hypothetical protein [Caulobacteraceae bacterium]